MIERICILVLINIMFFWKSLYYNYVSDDIPVYTRTKDEKEGFKKRWRQICGFNRVAQKQDHAITLVLHMLTSIIFYIAFGANDVSFLASILFCLNPSNNQGSVWISGRSYVIPTLFMLASMSLPYCSPLFLYVSTYFNAGFIAPAVFLFSKYWYFLAFMPIIWFLRWKVFKKNVTEKIEHEMFAVDREVHWRKLVIFFKTIGYYFYLCIIPHRNTFYHAFLQSAAGNAIMRSRAFRFDRYFFLGLSISIAMLWYTITHRNMLSFSFMWYLITIAPFCNMFRVSQEIAERYLYLPSVGLMFSLAYFTINYPMLYMFIIGVYACKLWFYMDAYQDDYYLTEVSCMNSRDAWFSWHVRGMKRYETGAIKEALTLWTMAKILSPREFKVLFNIATVLKQFGNDKESEEYMKQALSDVPAGQEKQIIKLYENYKKGNLQILL